MKRFFLISTINVLCTAGLVYSQSANFIFTPAKPRPGDVLQITYTPPAKLFSPKDTIQLTIMKFGEYSEQEAIAKNLKYKETEINLKKSGNSYQASVPTDAATLALAFNFTFGKTKFKKRGYDAVMTQGKFDTNDSLGYIVFMYDKKGGELPGSNYYVGEYYLHHAGAFGFQNMKLARSYFMKDLEQYPEKAIRPIVFLPATYSREELSEYEPIAKKQLNLIFDKDSLNENDYDKIAYLATQLGLKGINKYFSQQKNKYNNGIGKRGYSKFWERFDKEQDIEEKYSLLGELNTRFNQLSFLDKFMLGNSAQVPYTSRFRFLQYVLSKSKGNQDQFNQYAVKLNYNKETTLYESNAISKELAVIMDSIGNLDLAEKLALDYLNYNKQQYAKIQKGVATPKIFIDDYYTKSRRLAELEDGQEKLNRILSDLYVKKGDNARAFFYYKTVYEAIDKNDISEEDNEHYAILAEKQLPAMELKPQLEKMITSKKWTPRVVIILKGIYIKEHNSDSGFDAYLAGLKKDEREEFNKTLTATQMNEPAPAFTLTDLDGKTVNLSDYIGKTVILDLWATWCGPCKASFPAMKKLQEQYKGNDKVKFLFIDTFERFKTEAEKVNAVKNFISKNDYPFHILFDTHGSSKVAAAYHVQMIPTKIIIDKNGNIRFIIRGYEPNEDRMKDELNTMLETIQ